VSPITNNNVFIPKQHLFCSQKHMNIDYTLSAFGRKSKTWIKKSIVEFKKKSNWEFALKISSVNVFIQKLHYKIYSRL
jgi:hypothetical protein